MNSAIKVRNVAERDRLGGALRHDTLRDHIAHTIKSAGAVFRRGLARGAAEKPGWFWALRDVSFDVQPGRCWASSAATGRAKSRC